MNLSERIREALTLSGKSQAAIARELGITPSAITQWLSGRIKTLKIETALALEKATGMSAAWIATGAEPKLAKRDEKLSGSPLPVLLVSWREAGIWAKDEENLSPPEEEIWVPCPVNHSDFAYALKVRGVSMLNPTGSLSFADGDLIYVEPYQEPLNGSIVVALIGNDEEASLRELVIEGGARFLQALNPAWPQKIVDFRDQPVSIGGVVLARTTIFKK